MSPTEVTIATDSLAGLSLEEPELLSLMNDEAFKRAWDTRDIIKQEADRCVAVIRSAGGAPYLLKSARPDCRKRLLGYISQPLLREHRALTLLDHHGIAMARAQAFVRWRLPGQPEQWCQIQEYLEGAVTLEQALTGLYPADGNKQMDLIAKTAVQLARLHTLNRYHGDMKLTNIMVKAQDIFLIDIRGRRSMRLQRWQQKDFARFLVGLREAEIRAAQISEATAIYQRHSGNDDARFMDGVDAFAKKISRRRIRRYGSPMKADN